MKPRAFSLAVIVCLAIASCVLLSGCAPTRTDAVLVEVRLEDSKVDVRAWCDAMRASGRGVGPAKAVRGCAYFAPDPWRCQVVALRPRDWNDTPRLQTLGHELLHCIGWTHP